MTETAGADRRRSKKRRLLFGVLAVLVTYALVELMAWGAINLIVRDGLTRLRMFQDQLILSGSSPESLHETFHPYVGWVMNPQMHPGTELGGRHVPVNGFGFNDEEQPIFKRNPDDLIVGVVGGSVAWQMTVLGEAAFRDVLRQSPAWRGRKIRIVRLAMPGYKQPQQLLALNYLLALGAEFDVIVNIDGYNEIALTACENVAAGVFAAYPRMWQLRTLDLVDPRLSGLSFRLLQIRAQRQELALGICRSRFRWSPIANLVWKIRDLSCEQELVELASALQERKAVEGRSFAAYGPVQIYDDEPGLADHLCNLWKDSSLQIHHLCRGNRINYLHFLQPNQYLAGTKPWSPLELDKMINQKQCNGKAVARHFPQLIQAGEWLQERGVHFHDLTKLFAGTEETIYADSFCHYNVRGNEILARAVARRIDEALSAAE